MLKDKAEHIYLQFFLGPRDLNIVRNLNKNGDTWEDEFIAVNHIQHRLNLD